jgi:cobyrinic acid a,c-diamide synthase
VLRCPAVLIAAPASGQGKTTVTSAWARLMTRRGHRVRVFKCGPDFLDPFWHELACGQAAYQLDLWLTGEDDIRQRLYQAAQETDLILIEGVMGLFDGTPSAADLAKKFGIPVLCVIDASAMAGTFGALTHGLKTYLDHMPWAGVLANKVASQGHAALLETSVKASSDWLGAVYRDADFCLPERHLGLTVAQELPDAQVRLDSAATALEGTPLGQLNVDDLQRWAVEFLPPSEHRPLQPLLQGTTIAVARDEAFCFIYQANLDVLDALGAQVVFFSPLWDEVLPACDALWLPGGYPELHAQRIASNGGMRASVFEHVQQGKPVWAECGGMMVLFDELVQKTGERDGMWGLMPGVVSVHARLSALGPQQLVLNGEALRGHTFHYSSVSTPLPVLARAVKQGPSVLGADGEAFYQQGPIWASYFHPWFASNPSLVAQLFKRRVVP